MAINFSELKIPSKLRDKQKFKIFYVFENGRSRAYSFFSGLPVHVQNDIKDLITKMATVENFKSPKIYYNLKHYNYGEIRPLPYRFFFFQKSGNNYIFFEGLVKKKDSLDDDVYKRINKLKEKYEKEFEKFKRI